MRPILFDTNAYASFKRNEINIIEIVQHAEWIGISPIVIGELIAGFDGGSKAKQNKMELQKFLESSQNNSISYHTGYFAFFFTDLLHP